MAELTNIHLLRCSDNGFADALRIDPAAQRRPAERLEHHEAQLPLLRLLISRHELHDSLRAKRGTCRRQPGLAEQASDPRHFRFPYEIQEQRELGSHDHPGRDGLAVEPVAIARSSLDGVAEGMAEIEQRPRAGLALVVHGARAGEPRAEGEPVVHSLRRVLGTAETTEDLTVFRRIARTVGAEADGYITVLGRRTGMMYRTWRLTMPLAVKLLTLGSLLSAAGALLAAALSHSAALKLGRVLGLRWLARALAAG